MSENIIGISALFHDSACCLIQNGVLIAAAQEERFTRIKNDSSLPVNSFAYCLSAGGITVLDVDIIAYYEMPKLKFERQIASGYDVNNTLYKKKLNPQRICYEIKEFLGYDGPIDFHTHHMSHIASAYMFSGFSESAVMVNDAVGEWATTSYAYANGSSIEIKKQINFPDSLGLFYSAITGYLGFKVNSGEYKVMGLAPYGTPKYVNLLRNLITSRNDGTYTLNQIYFDYINGKKMYSPKMEELFGMPARKPESELTSFHIDLANSLQVIINEIILKNAKFIYSITKSKNLCLAGGVALNCVANRYLRENGPFKHIFIQPASGDAGAALGAAALTYANFNKNKYRRLQLENVYLGKEYDDAHIKRLLDSANFIYTFFEDENLLTKKTAELLSNGFVVGWYQGRMEFGPRALGNRSILADPRNAEMRDTINLMVKKRESFRPFAPAVLAEKMTIHFDIKDESPFMLNTCDVISPLKLPAITHVDNSARVQTVSSNQNPLFYKLIYEFDKLTGCPIILNTSFNIRGEPIVECPENAIDCFINTDIDHLVIGYYHISRNQNRDNIERFKAILNNLRPYAGQEQSDLYTFI